MRIAILTLVAVLLSGAPALAQAGKVGAVDLQKAGSLSMAGKAARDKIAKKVEDYQKTIDLRQEELKKLEEEKNKQSFALSEEARAEKERNFQQKLKAFQRFAKDAQEELQQEEGVYTRQILEELFEVVKQIGEEQGFSLIVEQGQVLFADPAIDLTEQVIKTFDAQYAKQQAGK